jgi:drug/metabolite transporter (DMT)-like permease
MLTQGEGIRASPAGLVAMVLGSTMWSAGSVLSQRRFELAPGAMGFASEMLCGGLVLTAMSLAAGEPPTVAANWPFRPLAVLAWAYLVVFGSLIAFNAYMVLLARASAGLASSYTFVNPVIAMLLGVWLADEVVTGYEWRATGVILLGVILLLMRRWRRT